MTTEERKKEVEEEEKKGKKKGLDPLSEISIMIISQTAVLIFLSVISIIALIILINDRSYGSRRQTGIH